MESKLISRFLLLSFFLINFIPPLQAVLDTNTWKLFLFSIVNTFAITYFSLSKDFSSLVNNILKTKLSIVVLLFILWAAISYIYAINPTEVFVKILMVVNFFLFLINLSVILSYNKFSFLTTSKIITIFFIAQLFFSYINYFTLIEYKPYTFEENYLLQGIYNNRNVTSALYLLQLPFVVYIVLETKSVFIKIISYIISFAAAYMIFLLASRTAYVIITVLLLSILIISFLKEKKLKNLFNGYVGNFFGIVLSAYIFSSISLGSDNTANAINRIQTIDFEETSTNTRLRYYSYGFEHFLSNPLIGVGYGSWKIKSIDYDKENIISYIIPYTMHNDFLEVAVELGLIGFILFILIFLLPSIHLYNLFRKFKSPIYITLASSLLVYLIDSNINFPFIRISSIFYIALVISIIYSLKISPNENS